MDFEKPYTLLCRDNWSLFFLCMIVLIITSCSYETLYKYGNYKQLINKAEYGLLSGNSIDTNLYFKSLEEIRLQHLIKFNEKKAVSLLNKADAIKYLDRNIKLFTFSKDYFKPCQYQYEKALAHKKQFIRSLSNRMLVEGQLLLDSQKITGLKVYARKAYTYFNQAKVFAETYPEHTTYQPIDSLLQAAIDLGQLNIFIEITRNSLGWSSNSDFNKLNNSTFINYYYDFEPADIEMDCYLYISLDYHSHISSSSHNESFEEDVKVGTRKEKNECGEDEVVDVIITKHASVNIEEETRRSEARIRVRVQSNSINCVISDFQRSFTDEETITNYHISGSRDIIPSCYRTSSEYFDSEYWVKSSLLRDCYRYFQTYMNML